MSLLTVKEIYPDTYQIVDPGIGFGGVNMYLLIGSDKALLIDSGYGALPIMPVIREITDKEVICVCTHGHLDHALGAAQFSKAYMHSKDQETFLRHSDSQLICAAGAFRLPNLPVPDPIAEDPIQPELVKTMISTRRSVPEPLDGIPVFDLGNRTVTWRLFPGHTQGSVVFFDMENHVAFDGDSAPLTLWLFLPESTSVTAYRDELAKYEAFLKTHGIKHRYTGYGDQPISVESLDWIADALRNAIERNTPSIPFESPFGNAQAYSNTGKNVFVCVPCDCH